MAPKTLWELATGGQFGHQLYGAPEGWMNEEGLNEPISSEFAGVAEAGDSEPWDRGMAEGEAAAAAARARRQAELDERHVARQAQNQGQAPEGGVWMPGTNMYTPQSGSQGQSDGGWSQPNPYSPEGQRAILQEAADNVGETMERVYTGNADRKYRNDKAKANFDLMNKLIDTIGDIGTGSGGEGGGRMRGFYDTRSRQAAALPGVHQTDVNTAPVDVGGALSKAYGTAAPAPTGGGTTPGISPKAEAAMNQQYNSAMSAAGSQNALGTKLMGARQNADLTRRAQAGRAAQGLDHTNYLAGLHSENVNNNLRKLQNKVYATTQLQSPLIQGLMSNFNT